MKPEIEFLNNKKDILGKFNVIDKSQHIIIDFMNYLIKHTDFTMNIIDHIFNSIVIIINYDNVNINTVSNLFKAMKTSDKLLICELSEQINEFSGYDYDDEYDSIVFDTFNFLKVFESNNNLKASINILHEIIFNISRINDKLEKDIKIKIYLELLNDIINKVEDNKTNKHIYLSTVEICNMTVRLLNDWIK